VVFFSNVCDIYVCYMLNKITYLLTYLLTYLTRLISALMKLLIYTPILTARAAAFSTRPDRKAYVP